MINCSNMYLNQIRHISTQTINCDTIILNTYKCISNYLKCDLSSKRWILNFIYDFKYNSIILVYFIINCCIQYYKCSSCVDDEFLNSQRICIRDFDMWLITF